MKVDLNYGRILLKSMKNFPLIGLIFAKYYEMTRVIAYYNCKLINRDNAVCSVNLTFSIIKILEYLILFHIIDTYLISKAKGYCVVI